MPKNQQIRRRFGFNILLEVSQFFSLKKQTKFTKASVQIFVRIFRQKKSSNHRKMMMVLPKTAFFDGLEPRHAD
jgi:hypothetical protein